LKCLSDATNGTFYSVTSKESFTNAFKEIIKSKQNYTENKQPAKKQIHYQFMPLQEDLFP